MSKALLAVSFGTSLKETRRATIERIEADLAAAFPERTCYRAWTSGFIRRKLQKQEGLTIDSVEEALARLAAAGATDLLVQPTHLLIGEEYGLLREALLAAGGSFETIRLGAPLLSTADDISRLAAVLGDVFADVREDEMLGLMGHGSAALTGNPYLKLDAELKAQGHANFCVGTVEEEPGFAPLLAQAEASRPRMIRLAPLMVVAGDHAHNDMAGLDDDSWKSRLEQAGFTVACDLRGLGEYAPLRQLYIEHARAAAPLA